MIRNCIIWIFLLNLYHPFIPNVCYSQLDKNTLSKAYTSTENNFRMIHNYNGGTTIEVINSDSTSRNALSELAVFANWGHAGIVAHGKGRNKVRWGHALGNWTEIFAPKGGGMNGMMLGTVGAKPLIMGTNATAVIVVDSTQNVGIGTETPSSGNKLHVVGKVYADSLTGRLAGIQIQIIQIDSDVTIIPITIKVTQFDA